MKLRAKVTITFVALLMCVVVAMMLAVGIFLPKVYSYSKKQTIKEAYTIVNAASAEETLEDEDFALQFESLGDKNAMSMLVMDSDGTVILSTGAEGELLVQLFREVLFGKSAAAEILEEAEDGSYAIEKYVDSRMNSDYIVLFGNLSGGGSLLPKAQGYRQGLCCLSVL